MGSSRAEEQRVESTGINTLGADEGEARTSSAGEDPGDVAAHHPTAVQQHGAGELPENERVAGERQDSVFGDIEKDLKKHDERERLLAEEYRDLLKERKEREKARRKRDGITTSNPVESASNSVESAPNPVESAPNPVESDQDTNYDDSCYIEIKNLVLIEKSVIHKKALEEWDRKEKLFASRVERKSTKVESRKNEVYNLIGFFSVFQGVVLTAVSQSNLLHCNNRWSPILLSVLASIVTIAGVYQKLKQIASLEKTIFSENQALKDVVHRGQALRREGKKFVFGQFQEDKKKESKKGYSTWYAFCVIGFLLVFTAAFPLSYWRILCDPGRNPYGAMSKIILKNDLVGKDVKIREGNAGSTRELCTLKPGSKFDIHNDKNATYREYIIITLPDNTKLRVLTSDDFAEFKEISVFEVDGKIDWMGTTERSNPAEGGLLKRLLHRFGLLG